MKRYGAFSEDKKEFVIKRPDTPLPWVNYISNGRYNGLISNTGGGFSFYLSPRDSRITRWRYNALPIDRPGRYLYIRDEEDGHYWSPTWQPTETALDFYECRHGVYYTTIQSEYRKLRHEITYFVPLDDDLEIWRIRLENKNDRTIKLNLFAFVELCLGHALVDLINQPNDQHFNEVFFNRQKQILFASKRYWVRYQGATVKQANEAWDRYVFMASSLPVIGWDGSKNSFIGRWRSEGNPLAVERGACANSEITAGDAVGVLQMNVNLAPGQSADFAVLLGVVARHNFEQDGVAIVQKYRDMEMVDAELKRLKAYWQEYLSHVQAQTPDEDMNAMLNVWNQYQTSVTFRFSRDASYYHGGLLFGRGFRDSCQDIMGPVIPRPQWVKERIVEMSQYQFADGSVFHLYHPLSGSGEKTGHSDTPLWLPLAIMTYLKESGDFDFLKQKTPFYDEGQASILEHLFRAIDFSLGQLTDRYLPRFGPGDWNDTLDYLGRKGKGESVWVAMFLAYILKETVELCAYLKLNDEKDRYAKEYQKVKESINKYAWDGDWYIRGTNDRGEVIGSVQNEEGKIFLNTQTWAVISGVAEGERAQKCMAAVQKYLDTPKGPKILHPAYTKIDPEIGLATRCVPGKKENGAVFNHPVSWAVLAECLLGRAERAYNIYKRALPMNPVVDIDRYEVEPYVYAEYVTSPDHPTFGQASHSWLTGSAVWMLRDAVDYILGVRPTYRGLLIDPCVPADWKEFKIKRKFRGKTYKIEVENPSGKNKGVAQIEVNGHSIAGNLIDLKNDQIVRWLNDDPVVCVKVVMGA
ncbi:GH36-type glycosyl hydrolase domain-containing protein [Caldithrix abyssi]